jgi:hypothetical protein
MSGVQGSSLSMVAVMTPGLSTQGLLLPGRALADTPQHQSCRPAGCLVAPVAQHGIAGVVGLVVH